MDSERADLSSISSALDELRSRIEAIADRARDQRQDDVASTLYDVERALTGAVRRLDTVVRKR
jgi:hypothetical protein